MYELQNIPRTLERYKTHISIDHKWSYANTTMQSIATAFSVCLDSDYPHA